MRYVGVIFLFILISPASALDAYQVYELEQDVEEILDTGSYRDLREFREEEGLDVLPWINTPLAFLRAKQAYREDSDIDALFEDGERIQLPHQYRRCCRSCSNW